MATQNDRSFVHINGDPAYRSHPKLAARISGELGCSSLHIKKSSSSGVIARGRKRNTSGSTTGTKLSSSPRTQTAASSLVPLKSSTSSTNSFQQCAVSPVDRAPLAVLRHSSTADAQSRHATASYGQVDYEAFGGGATAAAQLRLCEATLLSELRDSAGVRATPSPQYSEKHTPIANINSSQTASRLSDAEASASVCTRSNGNSELAVGGGNQSSACVQRGGAPARVRVEQAIGESCAEEVQARPCEAVEAALLLARQPHNAREVRRVPNAGSRTVEVAVNGGGFVSSESSSACASVTPGKQTRKSGLESDGFNRETSSVVGEIETRNENERVSVGQVSGVATTAGFQKELSVLRTTPPERSRGNAASSTIPMVTVSTAQDDSNSAPPKPLRKASSSYISRPPVDIEHRKASISVSTPVRKSPKRHLFSFRMLSNVLGATARSFRRKKNSEEDLPNAELAPSIQDKMASKPPQQLSVSLSNPMGHRVVVPATNKHSERKCQSVSRVDSIANFGVPAGAKPQSPLSEVADNSRTDVKPAEPELSEEQLEKLKKRLRYVVDELRSTEEQYVKDLTLIVNEIKPWVDKNPMPPPDTDNGAYLFGNIARIERWHRETFLPQLRDCQFDCTKIAKLFKRYARTFQMYVFYCQNQPKGDFLYYKYKDTYFETLRTSVIGRMSFQDLMIKPVQRLTKYQLILKDCLKMCERARFAVETTALQDAVRLMISTPQEANDMMLVASIKEFKDPFDPKMTKIVNFSNQGKLIRQAAIRYKHFDNSNKSSAAFPGAAPPTPKLSRKHSSKFKKSYTSSTLVEPAGDEQVLYTGRLFIFEQCLVLATQCDVRTERLGFNCEFVIRAPTLVVHQPCKYTSLPGFSLTCSKNWKGSQECFIYCDNEETSADLASVVKGIAAMSSNFIRALSDPKKAPFGM